STINLYLRQTKSTTYGPIGACRLNFRSRKRWARSRYQSRCSASVIWLRRPFANARFIPLSRFGLRPNHPLPQGERGRRVPCSEVKAKSLVIALGGLIQPRSLAALALALAPPPPAGDCGWAQHRRRRRGQAARAPPPPRAACSTCWRRDRSAPAARD